MTLKVKIGPSNEEFHEGSATWLIEAYGYEFSIHFKAGEFVVYGTQSLAYDRRPRWQFDGAKNKCVEFAKNHVAFLGDEFMERHRALYEMDK